MSGAEWPERLSLRDTGLHDDQGGLGQRIFTTAGQGYEKRTYVRDDLCPVGRGQTLTLADLHNDRNQLGMDIERLLRTFAARYNLHSDQLTVRFTPAGAHVEVRL